MRPIRRRLTHAVLPALLLVAPGCGEGGKGVQSETPVRGGTVVVAGSHDLQNMNGLVADDQDTADLLKHALFMTLVRFDADQEYLPYLAESWEVRDSVAEFRLRRDVRWHDGRPTTARDVAFTFERLKDPEAGAPMVDVFDAWESAEAVDSFTVRFRLRPHADPLYGWTELPVMPAHLLDTVPAEAMRRAAFNGRPVGNGPFRFVSRRENDRWIFEANPDFPADLGGRPYLDRVVWRVIPESAAQLAELRTGNAHVALSARASQLPGLASNPAIRVIQAPSNNYAFVGWNTADPLLADPRVRRALTHGMDRQGLLDGLRGGYGTVAFGPVPPAHWAHHPTLEPLAHDPARAGELLEEAGWHDRDGDGVRENEEGQPLSLTLKIPSGVDFSRDAAEVLRADLAEIGVRLETRALEAGTLFDDITAPTKRFQGVLLTLAGDFRLDLRDSFHSRSIGEPFQLSSWSSPEADSLMDRLAAAGTREAAVPAWHRLQELMREAQPWTFLYYAPTILAVRSELKGVEVDERGILVTLPRWWLAGSDRAASTGGSAPAGVAPRSDSGIE